MPRERYQVWTDAEVAWLREARAQGATFNECAQHLGRTGRCAGGRDVRPQLSRFYTPRLSKYWSLRGCSKPLCYRRHHNGDSTMGQAMTVRCESAALAGLGFAFDEYAGTAGGWTLDRGASCVEVFAADNAAVYVYVVRHSDGATLWSSQVSSLDALPSAIRRALSVQ